MAWLGVEEATSRSPTSIGPFSALTLQGTMPTIASGTSLARFGSSILYGLAKTDDPNLAKEVPLAIVGIVPCKVSAENGPIEVGDLLVASSTPGHAMKGTDRSRMLGAVVGKALERLCEDKGVIQVLVTLQ